MLLDTIKTKLFEKYKKEDVKGMFFSLFDKANNLLVSNGVLETDKNMKDLTEIIYAGLLDKEKNVVSVVIDVVLELKQETDMSKLLALPVKENGVFIINNEDNKSGVVLPDTKGIADIKSALGLIKQKYGVNGNVLIYVFKTDRIAFGV